MSKKVLNLIVAAIFLLAACKPWVEPKARTIMQTAMANSATATASAATEAPTPTPTATQKVCYGDPEKVYTVLNSNSKPITYQGLVEGWMFYAGGDLFYQTDNGPSEKINTEKMIEGLEYTIEIQIRINPDSIGTLQMIGFVCGKAFYFYMPTEANPFFIG